MILYIPVATHGHTPSTDIYKPDWGRGGEGVFLSANLISVAAATPR
jgi:hypothetical protein